MASLTFAVDATAFQDTPTSPGLEARLNERLKSLTSHLITGVDLDITGDPLVSLTVQDGATPLQGRFCASVFAGRTPADVAQQAGIFMAANPSYFFSPLILRPAPTAGRRSTQAAGLLIHCASRLSGEGHYAGRAPTGPVGPIGPGGPVGPAGLRGETGGPGPVGPVGPVGPSGGPVGPQGAIGPVGDVGPVGPAGPEGPRGPQGVLGPVGPQGARGLQGDRGNAGPQGERGPQGVQGERGASGPQGVQGPRGETGPQGPQGIRGEIGPVGGEGMRGPIGLQGPVGPVGPPGATGPLGPVGGTGPAGPVGAVGPRGEQGPIGLGGPRGEQGVIGPQGAKGNTGPAGPIGPQGIEGPLGHRGLTGATGPAGPIGPQGLQGVEGPRGVGLTGLTAGGIVVATGPDSVVAAEGLLFAKGALHLAGVDLVTDGLVRAEQVRASSACIVRTCTDALVEPALQVEAHLLRALAEGSPFAVACVERSTVEFADSVGHVSALRVEPVVLSTTSQQTVARSATVTIVGKTLAGDNVLLGEALALHVQADLSRLQALALPLVTIKGNVVLDSGAFFTVQLDSTDTPSAAYLPKAPAHGLLLNLIWTAGADAPAIMGNGHKINGADLLAFTRLYQTIQLQFDSAGKQWRVLSGG